MKVKVICKDIYEMAKAELGYDETSVVSEIPGIDKSAVNTFNFAYKEVFFASGLSEFKPISNLDDEIEMEESVIYQCLVPCIASKIAFDYGDGKLQAFFANAYNQGLRNLNSTQTQIVDVLPSDYMNA